MHRLCLSCPQICHEFERFSARLRNIKVANFFGGLPMAANREAIKKECPNIIVGTPGRIKAVRKQGRSVLIWGPACAAANQEGAVAGSTGGQGLSGRCVCVNLRHT